MNGLMKPSVRRVSNFATVTWTFALSITASQDFKHRVFVKRFKRKEKISSIN